MNKGNHQHVNCCLLRLHTSPVYRHQHSVPRRPLDELPCHKHAGPETYHSMF